MTIKSVLDKWLTNMKKHEFPNFESLPDVDLYMAQVLSIMDNSLNVFENTIDDKLITKPMINNYVKDGILPSPIKKKYSKEQIVRLFQLSVLKNVLELNEINTLLKHQYKNKDTITGYSDFNLVFESINEDVYTKILETTKDYEENNTENYLDLSLKLAIEGFSHVMAARKIIYLVNKLRNISKIQSEINKEITHE